MVTLHSGLYLCGCHLCVKTFHECSCHVAATSLYCTLPDIQFWRSRKSLEGLSVRSVFFNVFQSLIVLLYILDNETNTVVKISIFVGLCIDLWKIHKVVNVKVSRLVVSGVARRLLRVHYAHLSLSDYLDRHRGCCR